MSSPEIIDLQARKIARTHAKSSGTNALLSHLQNRQMTFRAKGRMMNTSEKSRFAVHFDRLPGDEDRDKDGHLKYERERYSCLLK